MKSRASKTWKLRLTPLNRSRLAGYGESAAGPLLSEVDHGALPGDPDQAIETQRASEHVVGKPLASGTVIGLQPHGVMDPETRVRPAEHLRDE